MEFKNTVGAMHIQAREIVDLIARLETSEDMQAIEFDLLLEKLRRIYDLVCDMKAAIPVKDITVKSESTEKVIDESELTETVIENDKDSESEVITKSSDDKKEELDNTDDKEIKQNKAGSGVSDNASFSDRFKSSKPSFNEKMADKSNKENLSLQFNKTSINSIPGSIALNEKFELINELFSGDKEKFEKTLGILNQADSFVEAYNYLTENFNWDMDSIHVQRVLELIRRKLIVKRNEQ